MSVSFGAGSGGDGSSGAGVEGALSLGGAVAGAAGSSLRLITVLSNPSERRTDENASRSIPSETSFGH